MWQPIDTAPNDGKPILVVEGEFVCVASQTDDAGSFRVFAKEWLAYDIHGNKVYAVPTHWMPLPDLPKSDN